MFNIILAHPNSLQIAHLCMVYDGTTLVDHVSSDHFSPPHSVFPSIILGK